MPKYEKLENRRQRLEKLRDKAPAGPVKRLLLKEYKRVARRLQPLKAARAPKADENAS